MKKYYYKVILINGSQLTIFADSYDEMAKQLTNGIQVTSSYRFINPNYVGY